MKTRWILPLAATAALYGQNSFQNSSWLAISHQRGPQLEGQAGPVLGKPFSGTEIRTSKSPLADGSTAGKTSTSKIYRDAEGRMRSEGGNATMLFDAPTMTNYTIGSKGCSYMPLSDKQNIIIAASNGGTAWSSFGPRKSGQDPHIITEDLGFQVVNGVSAKGMRETITIPASSIGSDHDLKVVNERWFSDALGVLIKSTNSDPRFGTMSYELTDINQSTPPASLFAAPTGCKEFQNPAMKMMQQRKD